MTPEGKKASQGIFVIFVLFGVLAAAMFNGCGGPDNEEAALASDLATNKVTKAEAQYRYDRLVALRLECQE
jgi:hypothetical protein